MYWSARRSAVFPFASLLALSGCPRKSPPAAVHDSPVEPSVARPPPPPRDACTGVGNPVGVRLPPGFCLRPVISGLHKPRQMALGPAGEILVAESGVGWRHNRGRVSILRASPDGSLTAQTLLEGLDRPHGIALHDGQLWIAEAARITSLPYPNDAGTSPTAVLAGLPDNGRHPHKTLAFGPDGALYFSVGSATDSCAVGSTPVGEEPCVEAQSAPVETSRAAIHRLDLSTRRVSTFATGLRNTLGLAWHPPSGRMWGVENGRDYIDRIDPRLADAQLPHEELNELVADGDYGWPYCHDANVLAPEYAASASSHCGARTHAPAILLPPHAAPISMMFYDGAMFPPAWRGRALITYHGYRAAGHRIVSLAFGPDGRPTGDPEDFVSGWEERPGRPHGHLAGLVTGSDGAVYVSDDNAGTLYRLAYGPSAFANATPPVAVVAPEPEAVVSARCNELARRNDTLSRMQREVIDTRCVTCHSAAAGGLTLRRCDWRASYESLAHGRSAAYGAYVVAGHTDQGVLMARLHGDTMGPRMPMQGVSLPPSELALVERWVREGALSP